MHYWLASRDLPADTRIALRSRILDWAPSGCVRDFRQALCGRWFALSFNLDWSGGNGDGSALEHPRDLLQCSRSLTLLDGWLEGDSGGAPFRADLFAADLQPVSRQELTAGDGEFSYAFLRSDGSALLASDFYGTRTVFYASAADTLCSDPRLLAATGILAALEIEPQACRRSLLEPMTLGEEELPNGLTFFKGLAKLPANGTASLSSHHRELRFDPLPVEPSPTLAKLSFADAASHFYDIFNRSVARRLRYRPAVLSLSGGVDSSLVLAAAHACGQGGRLLDTVTMGFRSADLTLSQDQTLASRLSRHFGKSGAVTYGDFSLRYANPGGVEGDPISSLNGPDPTANSLIREGFGHRILSAGAGQILTGEGGDAILGEDLRPLLIDSLLRSGRIDRLPYFVRFKRTIGWRDRAAAAWHALEAKLPILRDRYYYRQAWTEGFQPPVPEYFTHSTHQAELAARHELRRRLTSDGGRSSELLGHRYIRDFLWPRAGYLDFLSQWAPYSHPFLTREIVTFALSVPPHYHIDPACVHAGAYRSSKHLGRYAYRNVLPDFARLKRRKTSYALMARAMLSNSRAAALDLFAPNREPLTAALGFIDPRKFRQRLIAEVIRASDPSNNLGMSYQYVRSVIELEKWLRLISKPIGEVASLSRPTHPRSFLEAL